ncbi:hypothetical protein EIP91_002816 [Steccherinum ochraceum]|uniref:DUF6533 domain-containing protein n=1 Tax=Steccherinum ochraceum TaxID=92696 RepID=A0A4R0RBE7_9APHY|nr:hypothetical protein EIP91_002816 [Steccherinum ochraceum]
MSVVSLVETLIKACAMASVAVTAYDTLLTFPQEVECIWRRRFDFVTALFFSQRYMTLLGNILGLIQPTYPTVEVCRMMVVLSYITSALGYLGVALFTTLRIWAISDRQWMPTLLVFVLSMLVPAFNFYEYMQPQKIFVLEGQCAIEFTAMLSKEAGRILSLSLRSSVIVTDLIVLVLTWMKTSYICRPSFMQSESTITGRLLRDGTVYFGFLLFLNLSILLMDVAAPNFQGSTPLVYIHDAVTANLVARFILDLRSDSTSPGSETASQDYSTIQFAARSLAEDLAGPVDDGLRNCELTSKHQDEEDASTTSADVEASGSRE